MAQTLEQAIRPLQIVVAALIAGVTAFLAIALVVGPLTKSPDPALVRYLPMVLGVVAMSSAAGYVLLRQALLRGLAPRALELRQLPEPALAVVADYRRFAVAGGGLIEGPTFLALITYLLTGQALVLGAAGLGIVLLATHFPTVAALRRLAEQAATP